MSFRERSAWITLISLIVCFGAYFGSILAGLVSLRSIATLHFLLACVIALVLLQLGLHALAARLGHSEPRAPHDERERIIQWRSHTIGFYVLTALVLAVAFPGHMGHGVVDLMHFILFDVVAASAVVSAVQIVMFRRGV